MHGYMPYVIGMRNQNLAIISQRQKLCVSENKNP